MSFTNLFRPLSFLMSWWVRWIQLVNCNSSVSFIFLLPVCLFRFHLVYLFLHFLFPIRQLLLCLFFSLVLLLFVLFLGLKFNTNSLALFFSFHCFGLWRYEESLIFFIFFSFFHFPFVLHLCLRWNCLRFFWSFPFDKTICCSSLLFHYSLFLWVSRRKRVDFWLSLHGLLCLVLVQSFFGARLEIKYGGKRCRILGKSECTL